MTPISGSDVTKVVIACDAGMGSSMMVASTMKKTLKSDVDVVHTPVNEIPADAQVVLCRAGLADRARGVNRNAVVPFQIFMGDPAFAKVENAIKDGGALEP